MHKISLASKGTHVLFRLCGSEKIMCFRSTVARNDVLVTFPFRAPVSSLVHHFDLDSLAGSVKMNDFLL